MNNGLGGPLLERFLYACAAVLAAVWMINLASKLLLEALPGLLLLSVGGLVAAGVIAYYRNRW